MRIGFNRNTDKSFDIRHFSGESSILNSGKKKKKVYGFKKAFQTMHPEMWLSTAAGSSNEGSLRTEIKAEP